MLNIIKCSVSLYYKLTKGILLTWHQNEIFHCTNTFILMSCNFVVIINQATFHQIQHVLSTKHSRLFLHAAVDII